MLKKLILSELEKEYLATFGYLEIKRGDFLLVITRNDEDEDTHYSIHLSNPYDNASIDKQMDDYYEKTNKKGNHM